MKKKLFFIFLGLGLILTSCGKGESGDKVFIYGTAGDIVNLDPAKITDTASGTVIGSVCEGVLGFKGSTSEIIPVLSEKYEISKDKKEYTFYLRKGVKFHDGTDMNADAVLFSWNRQFDKNHEYFKYGPWIYWEQLGFNTLIKSLEKIDDYTVKIVLNQIDATFLGKMAMRFPAIVSPTAIKKSPETFNLQPVCTGPFTFGDWKKGQMTVLNKFQNYWGEKAKVDKVVVRVIPDPSARVLAVQKGEVHLIVSPPVSDVKSLKNYKGTKILEFDTLAVTYFSFNTMHKILSDARVRKAIAHAIDKKAIVEAVTQGFGKVAIGPYPDSMLGYDSTIKDYEYSLEKSKKLLKEAGHQKGFTLELYVSKSSAPRVTMAEILQNSLAKVGIKLKINVVEWGTFLNIVKYGKHDVSINGWVADYNDPDNFLYSLYSAKSAIMPALNQTFWKHPKFNVLLEEGRLELDLKKREDIYKQAQVIFHEEIPAVPLVQSPYIYYGQDKVKNFYQTIVTEPGFESVDLEE